MHILINPRKLWTFDFNFDHEMWFIDFGVLTIFVNLKGD